MSCMIRNVKISFVCNQNQARSQILDAVFSQILQESNCQSFGLIAKENNPLPQVIHHIFADWGLSPIGRYAKNMNLHWDEIEDGDLIVAMTTFIATEARTMGFKGEIIDLQLEAARLGIEVVDPQLMLRRQCGFELAKYIKVAFSALENRGYIRNTGKVTALMPENEGSIEKAIALSLSPKFEDSKILYGDLVAPRTDLFKTKLAPTTWYKFNKENSEFEVEQTENQYRILRPLHAIMNPSMIYLSMSWLSFIQRVQNSHLLIITPPVRNPSGLLAESFLAAISATDIQSVS